MSMQKIVYAGHSAVFIETKSSVIAIDPWLEGNPLCPDSLKNPEKLDLIVLTHGHSDHASDALRLSKHTGATIAATFELASLLAEEGVPQQQIQYMNKGGTIIWHEFKISLTHAMHSSTYDTANGTRYAGEPCGVVIRDHHTSLYHAGDTALFSDLSLIREHYNPTIGLLPIGDRFTMGPIEAAEAAKLLDLKLAIPIHHSTFELLTGTPAEFSSACSKKGIETKVLVPGESLDIG